MTMSRRQLNSKFVKTRYLISRDFITEVKLNRGLKESNFDQLYAYLKQHEVHANENIMMMERFIQPTNDPLALVSNASNQKYPKQSSESPQSSNQPSIRNNARGNVVAGMLELRECPQPKRSSGFSYSKKDAAYECSENGDVLDESSFVLINAMHSIDVDCGSTNSLVLGNLSSDVIQSTMNPDHPIPRILTVEVKDHDTFVDHMMEYH
ncbi:hypothetical protein Tco_0575078 [Tanacetum coccineum]